ncbi:hypothetical protein [Heterosigma akashiwo virus 01]|uniref:Uncharacterized protein n=1 Tax=Heterosigma akashiwo virus 01 TaxID=97195 RepID=A0A1C9C575_HAV01|nr:hypothetical protein D1R72_gp108 [Heterosigma akashiwo virus 01]AOM63439.1 hypothetical protein [Heterosigma akashiwo virus 01]
MVNVKDRVCVFENCKTRPCYNYFGEKQGLFCALHKHDDIIDVVHRTCVFENCKTIPYYNYIGEKRGLFCALHKHTDMVNVKHRICVFENCTSQTRYGLSGNVLTHCSKHKLNGMLKYPCQTCLETQCNNLALYSNSLKPTHCEHHMLENQINIIERKCQKCDLYNILDETGHCMYCTDTLSLKRLRKSKENIVKQFLSKYRYNFVHNKIIETKQCGLERPDFLFDCISHYVILEVDEHQHTNYNCETTRIINIHHQLGGMPLIVIRLNPDNYKNHLDNNVYGELFHIHKRFDKLHMTLKNIQKLNTKM